jgi:hypothetical protein
MTRRLFITIVFSAASVVLLALGACTTKFKPLVPVLGPLETPDSVQAIFSANCAETPGCHTGPTPTGDQDLSAGKSYAMIVDHVSSACAPLMRIRPFYPDSSCIMERITGRVQPQMPLGGPYLAPADTSIIFNWIKVGAPGVRKPV